MWTPRPAQPVLLYMTTYFSFEEIANKHNQHLAGWNDKIEAAKYSRSQGDEAMQWLEDPKNLPSLATINYELANDDHGVNSWVEVPDPNPDATEAFKQYYSPQSWDETDKDSRTKEGKKKLKHLQSPLVLYAFLDYTLHNTKGRRSVYAERGFSAGQLVGGCRQDDDCSARNKGWGGRKSHEEDRENRGQHNGDRGGKALEHVVRIFDNDGDENAAGASNGNGEPYEGAVAREKAVCADSVAVLPDHGECGRNQGK